MLPGLPTPFLLAAWVAVVAGVPLPEQCTSEMNKIWDLLEVSCAEQGLTGIPTGLPKDTGVLLLASNRLTTVALASFQHLPQLRKLDLSNNSLIALDTGAALPKLEQLLLSHNSLESLPDFSGLPSLTCLALGHNKLSRLPEGGFRDLRQLKELELQGNQLRSLPGAAFEGLKKLMDLDLSDNRLEALPPELLAKTPKLEILRLERNQLERLPNRFFSGTEYAYIYLVENPWVCDCWLDYLRTWINNNEFFVYTRLMVEEDGLEKEHTENEPEKVLCHGPPEEKGQPVMSFQTECGEAGNVVEQEVEDEGGPAGDSWTPSLAPFPSVSTGPLTAGSLAALRRSSRSPSTAISLTGAALPATRTSALRSTTTRSLTTVSSGPTTAPRLLATTAAVATSGRSTAGRSTATSKGPGTTPGPSTKPTHVPTTMATSRAPLALRPTASMLTTLLLPSAPPPMTAAVVAASRFSPSGATAGMSAATSKGPTTAPGPSTKLTHVPTTMAGSHAPLALSPTASMLTTPLLPSGRPPTMTTVGHPPSTAALVHSPPTPTPTHVKSSPRISAPLSTLGFSPSPSPMPSAHCLCPALPVRVLGVAAHKGSHAEWLSVSCCLLRLALYLPCLVLVVLLTLALLCWLGWLYFGWSRLAVREAWQKASPEGRQWKFAEAPRPTAPRIYRVCKTFQVGPSRHVTWLLVSLPGSARKWAQMQARLSSYSLDRGRDTLGSVRVRYAAASL